ncbi:energy-coupling factor transporter transmembrane component T family protein [Demequina mangrovi]|uniref:Energy-coupling factor transport system permease protein n=1 Tax=Demequina mangrovi TaxID=1043493 RepID=A0A1H6UI63_9MICO|nr:energy-coupling factor transporter transmembrane component T [Demequina mangrovi]SEI92011.1 energy-coupling factor transport system permease protein [Demequina mangrovi]
MSRKTRDVLSVEWVKLELIRTAYATRGGLFAKMDARMVIGWYLMLAVAPWLTHSFATIIALFVITAVSAALARVGPLVLGLFLFGFVTDFAYAFLAAWLFGGDAHTAIALIEINLKLASVSLASIAAFVSLDPEKLSTGLLALGAPELLAFGVSYGYRMMPILFEEFGIVFTGLRLRSAPGARGFLGLRALWRWGTYAVQAFYPIFLNTAKSVRTTVESLETRGFTANQGRDLRIARLSIGTLDVAVVATTAVAVVGAYALGAQVALG